MITNPRYNDPDYILNKLNYKYDSSTTTKLDVNEINGPVFNYPQCGDSCLNNNNTIVGANYIIDDGRCFKATTECDKYDCLIDLKSNQSNPKFVSCAKSFDTRLPSIVARYIRIERGISVNPVSINKLEAYDIYGSFIPIKSARAFPVDDTNYGSNLLLNNNENKIAKTLNTDNAYIQIDLGSDFNIYMVLIKNTPPYVNIMGNNLVLIKNNQSVSLRYPINYVYSIYLITTKYDLRYIPKDNEIVIFDAFSYPSCIPDGCYANNSLIKGATYTLDHPPIKNDIDALMPYDNRCFKVNTDCGECLNNINDLNYETISTYFASCQSNINTLLVRVPSKFIRLQRTIGDSEVSLSEFEVYDGDNKIHPNNVKSYPRNLDASYANDNIYTNDISTGSSNEARIQFEFNDNTMITTIYLSILTNNKQKMIGTTLFVINKYGYIVHNFTFTAANINKIETIVRAPNVTTYKLIINGTGDLIKTKINVSDIYFYPSCKSNGCVTSNENQLVGSMYIFDDNRCVIPKTDCSTCLPIIENNEMSLTDIEANYNSCDPYKDTRIIPAIGRYIVIKKDLNFIGFDLSSITINGVTQKLYPIDSYGYPINKINNTTYPTQNAYDGIDSTYASVRSSPDQNPYMVFDLGNNYPITSIKLEKINNSLDGTKIYIQNDNKQTVFASPITFNLSDINSLTINTAIIGNNTYDSISTTITYIYPSCVEDDNCIIDNHFLKGQKYINNTNDTCIIAKNDDPYCLSNIGNLYGSVMDECFEKCDSTDKRYGPCFGRIVRIYNNSANVLEINQIFALDGQQNNYNIVSTYSKGAINTYRSDNLLNATDVTRVSGSGSYIQIDLGIDKIIYNVTVNGNISGSYDTEVINSNGQVVSRFTITGSGTYLARQNINPIAANPGLQEEFEYPACASSTDKFECVDKFGKSKPLFKYTTNTGACGIAIQPYNNMDKLVRGTMSLPDADAYFRSCGTTETRYPALRGRYIRLQTNGAGFSVNKLEALSSETTVIVSVDAFAYPSDTNNINLITGSSTTTILNKLSGSTINPFAQIDIGANILIKFVRITANNALNDVTLYIITEEGSTVFQQPATTGMISIAQFPNNFDTQTLSYNFDYPSCSNKGCTPNNHQVYNQMYNINQRCLKSAKKAPISDCLSKAAADTLFGSEMNTCFNKCGIRDTRYNTCNGKYVRITMPNTTKDLKISEIIATTENDRQLSIYSTYSHSSSGISIDSRYRSDNINKRGLYAKVEKGGFIQIEFDTTYPILNLTISTPENFSNLIEAVINIYNDIGDVVYEYEINQSTPGLSDTSKVFEINQNKPPISHITLGAIYSYPDCKNTDIECVTESGKSKPKFKYNLSNGRCAIAKNTCADSQCVDSLNNNLLTSSQINRDFDTCISGQQTQYSVLSGRYIRIERVPPTTSGFKIHSIDVYNGSNKLNPQYTRLFPLSGTNYSKYLTDSDDQTFAMVGNAEYDADGNLIYPFVQLDFNSNIQITRVVLTTDGTLSLNNTLLKLIDNSENTVYQTNIVVTNGQSRYSYDIIAGADASLSNSTLRNVFNYNSCTTQGCIDEDKHIENQSYRINNRCYKAKGYLSISQCLAKANNNTLSGNDMDVCFSSCSLVSDTRYDPLSARFIRIQQLSASGSPIELIQLYANTIVNGSELRATIVTKHCKGSAGATFKSDNLNTQNGTAKVTNNQTSYIQIDLGQNVAISSVHIQRTRSSSLNLTELIAIAENGIKQHSTMLDTSMGDTFGLIMSKNVLNGPSISITETYAYNPNSLVYNEGLDENGKPKLLYIYNFSNGLSAKCIRACDDSNCLNDLYNGIMSDTQANQFFESTSVTRDTRFLTPIGKFLIIKRINGQNGFNISSLTILNDSDLPISSSDYSYITYPVNKYGSIYSTTQRVDSIQPFVQIEFNTMQSVRFLRLNTDTSINDCTIFLLDNTNQVIVSKLISNVTNNGVILIELLKLPRTSETMDTITTFNYDACKDYGCVPDNKHYRNQKYNIGTRCVKAKDDQRISACLDNINNLYDASMNNCFDSCTSSNDTRYVSATGRFIRISANTSLSVYSMKAYDSNNILLTAISAHINNPIDSTKGQNLLDVDETNLATCSSNGYIQIDLGVDVTIKRLVLTSPNVFNNTRIQIINNTNKLTHESYITTVTTTATVDTVANKPGTETLIPVENFSWPSCKNDSTIDCRNNTNVKPKFTYTLQDNRCLKAKTAMPDTLLSQINEYNVTDPTTIMANFDSCSDSTLTQFNTINGRYVRIRTLGTAGMKIMNIIVKNNSNVITQSSMKTFVKPLKTIDGEPSYGAYLVDTDPSTTTQTDTISGTPIDALLDKGYVQIDLGSNQQITEVQIEHETATDAATLNNAELIIASENNTVVYRQSIPNNNNTSKRIIVQSAILSDPYTFTNSEIFMYPDCVTNNNGCITRNNNAIKDFRYKLSDNRCFKALSDNVLKQDIDDAQNRTISNIDTKFTSCDIGTDTRYISSTGRFIRIEKTGTNVSIALRQFTVTASDGTIILPVDIHVKPAVSASISNYNSIMTGNIIDVSTGLGNQVYFQLDIGSDRVIKLITLLPASTNSSSLSGTTLYIIKEDNTITFQKNIL